VIRIENLGIDLGGFHLRELSLHVRPGEYMVLLGPTGAGKTVLLECIAGFHRRHAGRVLVDGVDMTGLHPEQRRVGYVPQDYALFPNLTVQRNVAYGLEVTGCSRAQASDRAHAMLDRLGLTHIEDRLPLNLSGGERQRAALGRALVTEPRVLLLDEPLSALDESLRAELARGLRQAQRELGRTFLHVCHSLDEAAEVADRIALLADGRIVQVGSLDELVRRPSSLFVARFTCTRNLLPALAEPTETGCNVTLGKGVVLSSTFARCSGPVMVGIRADDVQLGASSDEPNIVQGKLAAVVARHDGVELHLDVGVPLIAWAIRAVAQEMERKVGQPARASVSADAVMVFPRDD
jgi:molybdate/tungstate transport system ATP-binding protein